MKEKYIGTNQCMGWKWEWWLLTSHKVQNLRFPFAVGLGRVWSPGQILPIMLLCDKLVMHAMCILLSIHCWFWCLPDIPPVSCSDGDVRLVYTSNYTQQYSSTSYTEVTSGFLEVCFGGSWISVCLNDTSSSQIAELACRNIIGYSGMLLTLTCSIHQYKVIISIQPWLALVGETFFVVPKCELYLHYFPYLDVVTNQCYYMCLLVHVFLSQTIPMSLHRQTTITPLMSTVPSTSRAATISTTSVNAASQPQVTMFVSPTSMMPTWPAQ